VSVPAEDPTVRHPEFHPIDDYLSEDWLGEWIQNVIGEIELYLSTFTAPSDHADAPPTLGLDEA
jgi:hypothetical protein